MIDDAPPLLAVRGNIAALARPMVAIVGARNASAAGVKFAERIARELGEAGFVIASGLARGIDAAAHRASLATGTVAVLAGGHDRIYPREHVGLPKRSCPKARDLRNAVRLGAARARLPAPQPPDLRPFARRRDRGGRERSGSLITARMALEQGREVFAVPGSPLDPRSEGTNGLLKQGATLVTEAADVIAVLEPILGRRDRSFRRASRTESRPPRRARRSTRAPDRACSVRRRSAWTTWSGCRQSQPAVVRTVLLELELAGRIERHGGGLVSLA